MLSEEVMSPNKSISFYFFKDIAINPLESELFDNFFFFFCFFFILRYILFIPPPL